MQAAGDDKITVNKALARTAALLLFGFAGAAAAPADFYAGIWSGEGLILTINKDGAQYGGRLFWQGRDIEIKGGIEDGVFYGEALAIGKRYSWLIERAGEQIRFTIDSRPVLLSRTGAPQPRPAAPASPGPPMATGRQVFDRVTIDDTGGWIGGSAGTMLAPAGWKTEARVEWFLHPTMPGRVVFSSVSANGRDRIRMYPNRTYFMGPMMVRMREGVDEYYGNVYQRPLGSARAVVTSILLPALRPQSRCTETESTRLPGFAAAVAGMNRHPSSTSDADAVRVRFQCEVGGRRTVEDLFAVYSIQNAGPASYWQAQYLISVTSDAAGIDRATAMVAPMLHSLRINMPWFNKLQQISDGFQQLVMQNIQLAARQSQIIRSVSEHVSENRRATYENMTRSNERSMAKFSEHIRGVELWHNHHGEAVSVPSGYSSGWQSDNGRVVLSDNPNLNPNTDPQLKDSNWHPMQR